jgi:tRNA(fMet)-specific endonuclease VapC
VGLIVDTNVFIAFERRGEPIALSTFGASDGVFVSAITVSELLMGVWRADGELRRRRRSSFVESLIAAIPILNFDAAIARVHAEIGFTLAKAGQPIGAHDLIIAATARFYGFAVLSNNVAEFSRVPGLQVIEFAI